MLSRRVGVQLEESALKHALHAQTPPTQEVSFGSGLVWRHPCFLDALAAEFVSPSCLAQQAARLASLRQNDGVGLAMPHCSLKVHDGESVPVANTTLQSGGNTRAAPHDG